MRFLFALAVILTVLLLPSLASADGPSQNESFGRESRIERRLRAVERENDYLRSLRRDYRQFRGSSRLQRLERDLAAERRRVSRRSSEPAPRRTRRYEREAQRLIEEDRRAADQNRRFGRDVRRYNERPEAERYAELDRRERITRDSAERSRCMPSMTGQGVERYIRRRAEESALKQWSRQVETMYGRRYVNIANSINSRYVCDPYGATSLRWQCRFRAAPCRGEF